MLPALGHMYLRESEQRRADGSTLSFLARGRMGRRHALRIGVMCTIGFHELLPGCVESQFGRSAVDPRFREGKPELLTVALDCGQVDLGVM